MNEREGKSGYMAVRAGPMFAAFLRLVTTEASKKTTHSRREKVRKSVEMIRDRRRGASPSLTKERERAEERGKGGGLWKRSILDLII